MYLYRSKFLINNRWLFLVSKIDLDIFDIIEVDEFYFDICLVFIDFLFFDCFYVIFIFNKLFFLVQVQFIVVDEEFWVFIIECVFKIFYCCLVLSYVLEFDDEMLLIDCFECMGCVVWIYNVVWDEGKIQFIVQGICRIWVYQWFYKIFFLLVSVIYLQLWEEDVQEVKVYVIVIIDFIKELVLINLFYIEELWDYLDCFSFNDVFLLIDFVVGLMMVDVDDL